VDVILDYSFWLRSERDKYRSRAFAAGAMHTLYYIDCSPELIKRHLEERNAIQPPGTIVITDEMLAEWVPGFEEPGDDEEKVLVKVEE